MHAQTNLNNVSINAGIIEKLFYNNPFEKCFQYTFYQELQCGGDLMIPFIYWTVYWGYWNDGVNEVLPIMDAVTYSFSSHVVGGRFTLIPAKLLDRWRVPIGFFAGIGNHFISRRYVGGLGYDGSPGQNLRFNVLTLDVGVNIEVKLFGPFCVQSDIQQLVPLRSDDYDRLRGNRWVFKLGLVLTQ
jgi:hypothetical protein